MDPCGAPPGRRKRGEGGARLTVYVTRYGAQEPGHTETLTFKEQTDEGADALMARAAGSTLAMLCPRYS